MPAACAQGEGGFVIGLTRVRQHMWCERGERGELSTHVLKDTGTATQWIAGGEEQAVVATREHRCAAASLTSLPSLDIHACV